VHDEQQLLDFLETFASRFEAYQPYAAGIGLTKSYVTHNEAGLAVEMLVDNLGEYDIPITAEELQRLFALKKLYQLEDRNSWAYIHKLVTTDMP
jgi:hypothetical protein